jgi:hypothetical protein
MGRLVEPVPAQDDRVVRKLKLVAEIEFLDGSTTKVEDIMGVGRDDIFMGPLSSDSLLANIKSKKFSDDAVYQRLQVFEGTVVDYLKTYRTTNLKD